MTNDHRTNASSGASIGLFNALSMPTATGPQRTRPQARRAQSSRRIAPWVLLARAIPLIWNRHGRACPGHPDAEGTAFQQNALGVARALLVEITGTSPVMTSVGASISSEHAR